MSEQMRVGAVGSSRPSRRAVLGFGAALTGGAGLGTLAGCSHGAGAPSTATQSPTSTPSAEPFHGPHQNGVANDPQAHLALIGLDLLAGSGRDELRRLMRLWTDDASRLTQGKPTLQDTQPDLAGPAGRLTVTVGIGPRAVTAARPAEPAPGWLGPLPPFKIDRLDPAYSGGDLLLQVCGDDPIVLSHAVRSLLIDTQGLASHRWVQRGFRRPAQSAASMRNLMGQVDGTVNPKPGTLDFDDIVWVGGEGPSWLRGGTGMVVRRIAMDLARWDQLDAGAKEEVIGRRLASGAPLTGTVETDKPDLAAKTAAGLSVIPDFAHIRHAAAVQPRERFLRRPYNYDEGASGAPSEEAGLVFITFQRDITTQFVPVQRRLADADLLNMWTTPVGSAVFAILPGAAEGEYLGQKLLE